MAGMFFFIILPYLALVSVIAGSIYVYRHHEFKISSLSSQLLESRVLFFGRRPFHWGIVTLFFGHLIGFLLPSWVLAWNGRPLRLYILEITALAFALLCMGGLIVLITRRIRIKRIRVVTSGMDVFVFIILFLQIYFGIHTALAYRWGSTWFATDLVPYLRSIFVFRPDITVIQALPLIPKMHIATAFILIGMIPYTRFMHFLVYPLHYLFRAYQVVIWNRRGKR
jgi:nitrate reductase gamma subunit